MKKQILFILLFLVTYNHAQSQKVKFHFGDSRYSRNSRIILDDYEIKGVKMKLLYDTGMIGGNLLTYDCAKKIGLSLSNDSTSVETFGGIEMKHVYTTNMYYDPLFGAFVATTHPDTFLPFLTEPVDGMVGYSQDKNCIEFNFQQNELCFYDSIPPFYMHNNKVKTALLVPIDRGHESVKYSKLSLYSPGLYIRGNITIADTLKIRTNFLIDTGAIDYLFLATMDSLLLEKIIAYKAATTSKYGDSHPTVRFEIPELSVDSMMTNVKLRPLLKKEHIYIPAFGPTPISGSLGVEFLKKYTKVLFDCKNNKAYFYKE
jgi:predicted aspartyl protease